MKIRLNYVSNSSSSSYCICLLGIVVDYNETGPVNTDDLADITSYTGVTEYSCDELIIGARPNRMRDDETLLDFKNRILEQIHQAGFEDTKIEDLAWHTDGGYDD